MRLQAASALTDDRRSPAGARRYHWPTSGPRPETGPRAYSGSVGTCNARRRWSTTACSTSGSAASRRASVAASMPCAMTTWARSLMVTPVSSGTPARAASRSARRCATAATALADWRTDIACSRSSGASSFSVTITRAGGWPCPWAVNASNNTAAPADPAAAADPALPGRRRRLAPCKAQGARQPLASAQALARCGLAPAGGERRRRFGGGQITSR